MAELRNGRHQTQSANWPKGILRTTGLILRIRTDGVLLRDFQLSRSMGRKDQTAEKVRESVISQLMSISGTAKIAIVDKDARLIGDICQGLRV